MFSYSKFSSDMFLNNSQFNGDLSNWNTDKVRNMILMFYDSPLEGKEREWFSKDYTRIEKLEQKRKRARRRAEEREHAEAMKSRAEMQKELKGLQRALWEIKEGWGRSGGPL